MKTYQKPNTKIVFIEIQKLIAVSLEGGDVTAVEVAGDYTEGQEVLSRFNLWDDEDAE